MWHSFLRPYNEALKKRERETIFYFAWMHVFVWLRLSLNFQSLVTWNVSSIISEKTTYLRKNNTYYFSFYILHSGTENACRKMNIFSYEIWIWKKSLMLPSRFCLLLSFICSLFLCNLLLNPNQSTLSRQKSLIMNFETFSVLDENAPRAIAFAI